MAGKLSFGLAAAGVLWCAAMLMYLPPSFASGDEWLVPLVIPVVLALSAFVALWRECTGRRGGHSTALTLASLLFAYSIATGFSIGMAIMPAAMLLFCAAAVVPSPR